MFEVASGTAFVPFRICGSSDTGYRIGTVPLGDAECVSTPVPATRTEAKLCRPSMATVQLLTTRSLPS